MEGNKARIPDPLWRGPWGGQGRWRGREVHGAELTSAWDEAKEVVEDVLRHAGAKGFLVGHLSGEAWLHIELTEPYERKAELAQKIRGAVGSGIEVEVDQALTGRSSIDLLHWNRWRRFTPVDTVELRNRLVAAGVATVGNLEMLPDERLRQLGFSEKDCRTIEMVLTFFRRIGPDAQIPPGELVPESSIYLLPWRRAGRPGLLMRRHLGDQDILTVGELTELLRRGELASRGIYAYNRRMISEVLRKAGWVVDDD